VRDHKLAYSASASKDGVILFARLKGGDEKIMYCVKCRAKREGKEVQDVTMKNGKKAKKAKCEVCGTTMFRIGG
jgi:hypothetical protein